MPITNTIRAGGPQVQGRTQVCYGKMVFSGNYPAGGDPFPASLVSKGTQKPPIFVVITGTNWAALYSYDKTAQKVVVRTLAGAEIPSAAYPAPIVADVIDYMFVFEKF